MAATSGVPLAGHGAHYRAGLASGELPHDPTASPGSVVTWLREAAAAHPEQMAVRSPDCSLTYRALDLRVRALAAGMRARGIGRGDLVGLSAARSVDQVVAMLAILRLGGVVCPVDLRQAPERARRLLAGIRPRLVLAEGNDLGLVPAVVPFSVLRDNAASDREADVLPSGFPEGGELAYVAHTSGSTGQPKAVPVPHHALANRIAWTSQRYPIGAGDTMLYAGSLVYDLSFWNILAPLCFGAAVAVAPEGAEAEPSRLAHFISDSQVTIAHFIPSLLTHFLAEVDPSRLASLRYLLCGGERLPVGLARQVLHSVPARLFNQYGPTEACIDVLDHEVTEPDLASEPIPLGGPLEGVTAWVLDQEGRPVADGEPGILHVGGACVAWGYLGMGARTAEEFCPDPRPAAPGARLYRTGDLARRRRDGLIEFLGRADDQVKILGVRVEPSEVEDTLRRHPAVTEAVVTTSSGHCGQVLVAHLAATGVTGDELRSFLADQLPAAAIPARYVVRPSLPRLASGKIDRAGLAREPGPAVPEPAVPEPAGGAISRPPATETERRIAEIWRDVLGVDSVGQADHFFQLGGQSLLAMRMIARVRRQFGTRVPVRTIFDAPTVELFSASLDTMLST